MLWFIYGFVYNLCSVCVEELRQRFQSKNKRLFCFRIPMIWREPKNHSNDCYYLLVQGINFKNRKNFLYPTNIRSAIHPIPHRPELPIPSPPDTLNNILDDLDLMSHSSSDCEDRYQWPKTFLSIRLKRFNKRSGPPKIFGRSFRVAT